MAHYRMLLRKTVQDRERWPSVPAFLHGLAFMTYPMDLIFMG
jgi:hypothetical protein